MRKEKSSIVPIFSWCHTPNFTVSVIVFARKRDNSFSIKRGRKFCTTSFDIIYICSVEKVSSRSFEASLRK